MVQQPFDMPVFPPTRVTLPRGVDGGEQRFRAALRTPEATRRYYAPATDGRAPAGSVFGRAPHKYVYDPSRAQSARLEEKSGTPQSLRASMQPIFATAADRPRAPGPIGVQPRTSISNFSNPISSTNWSMPGNRSYYPIMKSMGVTSYGRHHFSPR